SEPLLIVAIGWGALLCLGAGWLFARRVQSAAGFAFGGSQILGLVGCLLAGTVAGAAAFAPQLLEQIVPGWKGGLGILCLIIALVVFSFAFVRFLALSVVVVLWLLICLVLGSEVFLDRLPSEWLNSAIAAVPPHLRELIPSAHVGWKVTGTEGNGERVL